MTCEDAEPLLDRFLDRDLSTGELLDVARHAGGCRSCDRQLRQLATLGRSLAGAIAAESAAVDLRGIWPAVATDIDRVDGRRRWTRRVRAVPLWASGFAVAASVALWIGLSPRAPSTGPHAERVALRTLHNDARIDRLAGRDVTVRREPKEGTTLIWVNYSPESPR